MDVSLIVPVYCAESFLRQSLEEVDLCLTQSSESWELILIDDASSDDSAKICQEFASASRPYPVTVLVNERNLGKGASVRRGILAAAGDYRIFTDCDLAYPMTEVRKVLNELRSGKAVAVASRAHEGSRYIFSPQNFRYLYTRHLASRLLSFLIRRSILPHHKDTQAGLKGFTAGAAKFLFSQLRLNGFSFDLELLHLAHRASLSVQEVPVNFYAQKVSTMHFFYESFPMLRDIFRIYYWSARGRYSFCPPLEINEEVDPSCG